MERETGFEPATLSLEVLGSGIKATCNAAFVAIEILSNPMYYPLFFLKPQA